MIVISDLNGTITNGSPVIGLVKWVRENQSRLRGNLFFASILPSYILAKRGIIDWNKWVMNMFLSCMPLLKNADPDMFKEVIEYTIDVELWKKRRLDMVERIGEHVKKGDEVYIATGMWQPTTEAFANKLGGKGLGTEVKFEDGRFLLAEPIAHGENKMAKIKRKLGVERVDVVYGDTAADILMLEMADHPVAVYPDEKLKAVAIEHGWEIFGERD